MLNTPTADRLDQTTGHRAPRALVAPRSLPLDEIAAAVVCRDDIIISIASPDEYADVEAVSRAADPHDVFLPITAAALRWFADDNPHGPGFIVIARSADTKALVGHFLFYATTLLQRVGSAVRPVTAYLYVNLYVVPAYRRQGVFASMFACGLDVLTRMGVEFAYTVPNPRSTPGFVKFGVPRLGTLPCWFAPAAPAWGSLAALAAWGGGAMSADRVGQFDDDMVPAVYGAAAVVGARTAELLNWRYGRRPDVDYGIWRITKDAHPIGYLVTRVLTIRNHRVMAVCDLAIADFSAAVLRQAIWSVVRQSASDRCRLVMLQGGPADASSRLALWRAGLIHVPTRLLPQPVEVLGGSTYTPQSTAGFPLLDQWTLTPGDWDVF